MADPTSRKFNTGQKEELKFIFCIEEVYDTLPHPQQQALLKRLRLFSLVIHYNWATALNDRGNQEVHRGNLEVETGVIVKNKPRYRRTRPRTTTSTNTKFVPKKK